MKIENVLVIGAHFDDAELGCGGTMARLSAEGKNVYKLTLTNNVTNFTQMNIVVDFESSLDNSLHVCEILNVKEITDFEFTECNHLEYSKDLMQKIEAIIYDKEIDTVFLHFPYDMNSDHIAASQLGLTAARHCKNILYYQSNGYILDHPFYPSVFFDISDYYESKKSALSEYQNEHNRFDRLFNLSLERTSIWGYANMVNYAEGFVPVKITY